ncbi:hypothetical protein U9M48_024602 [Paspalum notatum var. saurae]|uniref:Uncharacterized protein n=1 Tax=Paspalum notatum var. saurae TaxID=547442 RepID=A0AAQ3WX95_PASNO
MVVPSLNHPRQATLDPLSVLALLEDEQKFKIGGVGRPLVRPTDLTSQPIATSMIHIMKKHKCTQIQPQDQASNVSKGRKCTKSRILNVINLREKQSGQCRPDTWSPNLLQGRPTYPRRHFTRATTVLTANRHGDARSSRWSAKAVDRVVARPQSRSADHQPRPATDLSLLQIPSSHMGL